MFNPFVFIWYVLMLLTRIGNNTPSFQSVVDARLFHAFNPLSSNSAPIYMHTVRVTYKRQEVIPKRDYREEFRTWRENNRQLFLTS